MTLRSVGDVRILVSPLLLSTVTGGDSVDGSSAKRTLGLRRRRERHQCYTPGLLPSSLSKQSLFKLRDLDYTLHRRYLAEGESGQNHPLVIWFFKDRKGPDFYQPKYSTEGKQLLCLRHQQGLDPQFPNPGKIEEWVEAFATETRNMAADEFTVGKDPITFFSNCVTEVHDWHKVFVVEWLMRCDCFPNTDN